MANPVMKAWQQRLIDVAAHEDKPNPLPKYGADGNGGRETQDAILRFQQEHYLPATGEFDDDTRRALTPQPQGNIVMNNILGGLFDGLLGNLLNWQLVQGYIRSGLTTAGGWIGLDGLVGADGSKAIIGALLVILGVIWQAVANNKKVKALDVVKAVDAHPAINVIPANENLTRKPIVTVDKAA